MTCLSKPRPTVHCFSSFIWGPILGDLSTGYGIEGLPPTSQRALLCSLLRLWDVSKAQTSPVSQRANTAQCLGVTLDTQLTWAAHTDQAGKKAAERLGMLGPLLNRRSSLSSEMVCCFASSLSVLWWIMHVRSGGPLLASMSRSCNCCNPSVFALQVTHSGALVTDRFTRIWVFHPLLTTSEHWGFWFKVRWCGEPLSLPSWKALYRWPRADWSHPRVTEKDWCSAGQSRLRLKMQPSWRNKWFLSTRLPWLFCAFPQL
jgi:hypothetical protein